MKAVAHIKNIFTIGVFAIFAGQFLIAETPTISKNTVGGANKSKIEKKERKAKLTMESKGIGRHGMAGVDHATAHGTETFILPDGEGKITAKGHYRHHGSMAGGYTLSGPSYTYGYVKNNELVLTASEWFFRGESMKRTEMNPHVHIPLKNGAKVTQDFHYSMGGAQSDVTCIYTLAFKDKQKWRFTIFQKDQWVRGNNTYSVGVTVKVRTDIDFEIEDGKYKKGSAKASILSINTISNPPGLSDCTVQNYRLNYTSYPVSGKVTGKSVKLEVTPENQYTVSFDCLIDKDKLVDVLIDKRDENRKGNKIRIMHQKVKRNGNTVVIKRKWEIKTLTDTQLKNEKKNLKKWAKKTVENKLQYYNNTVTSPLYPLRSERTIIVPLKNFTKDFGKSESENFMRIQMERIE